MLVASLYRPLHIYRTLPHWEYKAYMAKGHFFLAHTCNVHQVVFLWTRVGSHSHHKRTALEFIQRVWLFLSAPDCSYCVHTCTNEPLQVEKQTRVRFKRTKLCGCEKTPWGIRELDSQEVVEPRNILSKLVVGLALVIFKFLTYHPTTVHVVCTCTCRLILCRELAANSPWQLHYLLWEQTSPSANFPFRFMHHVREM